MTDDHPPVDTMNKFLVAARGEDLCFLRPVPQVISHADALLLAAYLVSMVGDDEQWLHVLRLVQNA